MDAEPVAYARPLRPAVTSVINDSELAVGILPGDGDRAVVSFSGIGLARKGERRIQFGEFGRTIDAAGAGDADLVFVIDRSQSWLNRTGPRVLEALSDLIGRKRSVTTLGNSMGGYAAFWAAGQLPNCHRAIGFSPQYAMDPAVVPFETRWSALRAKIEQYPIRHAFEHSAPHVDYWSFCGSLGKDRLHAAYMQGHDVSLRLIQPSETDHGLVQTMQENGTLVSALRLLLADRSATLADLLPLFEGVMPIQRAVERRVGDPLQSPPPTHRRRRDRDREIGRETKA